MTRGALIFLTHDLARSGGSSLGVIASGALQRRPRLAERGRVIVPCKDWPSATAYGGCGLDEGRSPGPRLPPRDRRQRPLARAKPADRWVRFFEHKWVRFDERRGQRVRWDVFPAWLHPPFEHLVRIDCVLLAATGAFSAIVSSRSAMSSSVIEAAGSRPRSSRGRR